MPLNAISALADGKKLNFSRCTKPLEEVNVGFVPTRKIKEKRMKMWKIVYPLKTKPKCQHHKSFIIDRSKLLPVEHLNLLATPKKRLVGPYPMWAERKIPLCTAKVDELARPKPHQLLDTFDQHLNHLSILQIENFLSKMYRKEYKTPKETITQCLMERRKRAGRQRKALRKMKFKMQRRALEATSKDAINFVRRHISTNRPSSNPTCTADNNKNVVKYSDVILLQLCKLMKQNMPRRNSCDLIGRIFINIADKLAVTMAEFIECSGLLKIDQPEINTECIKGHQKNCYPIDDCYEASSDDEVTSEDEFEDSVENLDIPSSSNQSVHEPTMSFLRPSQIIVDKEDCKNMFGQLANLKRLQAEKDAVKTAKRDARAKARAAMKKKKDGSQDCYGNVDEKPQWHVEWTEK